MATTSQFVKRMNDYKKCMRILNCANHVYLDEIDNFEFKKISKYNKSKNLYNKITHDFKLVNELIDKIDSEVESKMGKYTQGMPGLF